LEVIALLLAANDDVPLWARKRVKAMADFLARLLHPDGEVPLFHGAALGVARPARELLATAAIVLHEPELAPPGDLPGVWPLLVVGDAGRRTHAHLPRRREGAAARALRRTGFYVLPGDPGDVFLLDGESPPAGGHDGAFGDELLGSGQWDVESFIHFHPEVRLTAACHGRPAFVASRSDAAAVEIVPAGVREIHVTAAVETPAPQGWYAARHGERRPAPVLSLAASVRLPF